MGLDLYVIPISAFATGDFESPLSQFFKGSGNSIPLTVLRYGPDGVTAEHLTPPSGAWGQVQRWTGIWALRQAMRRFQVRLRRRDGLNHVVWLRRKIRLFGVADPSWNEEGGAVLSRQFDRAALYALKAYALCQEYPNELGGLSARVGDDGVPFPIAHSILDKAESLKLKSERFRHLCDHSDSDGYYIPLDFELPLNLKLSPDPDSPGEDLSISVGSTSRLLSELVELNRTLGLQGRWDTRKDAMNVDFPAEQDVRDLHYGWYLMEGFARTSLEHRMPICFDG